MTANNIIPNETTKTDAILIERFTDKKKITFLLTCCLIACFVIIFDYTEV